jgi:protein-glutamine gamma-glutamyltransferase
VVSYDDAAKEVPQPRSGVTIDQQVKDFPSPIIADEIHIKPKEQPKKEEEEKKRDNKAEEESMTWMQVLLLIGIIAGGIVVLLFMLPRLYFWWLLLRLKTAGEPKKQADRSYRLALYHFHMAGVERARETPMQYAQEKVDPQLHAGFAAFMNTYLRLKYGNNQLLPEDPGLIRSFAGSILRSTRNEIGFFNVLFSYLNLSRANRYFRRPPDKNNEA